MQAIEGGTSQGGMVGGSGNIGMAPAPGRVVQFGMKTADNLNPQAPDCYFYYYSNCAKVRERRACGDSPFSFSLTCAPAFSFILS